MYVYQEVTDRDACNTQYALNYLLLQFKSQHYFVGQRSDMHSALSDTVSKIWKIWQKTDNSLDCDHFSKSINIQKTATVGVVKRYVRFVEMLNLALVSNIGRICWAGKLLIHFPLEGSFVQFKKFLEWRKTEVTLDKY